MNHKHPHLSHPNPTMARRAIVAGVACLHYFFGHTAFIKPFYADVANEIGTTSSPVAGTLILIATCLLLMDSDIGARMLCPTRYDSRLSIVPRLIIESIVVVLALEFVMVFLWSRLEQFIHVLVFVVASSWRGPLTTYSPTEVDAAASVVCAIVGTAALLYTAWLVCYWKTLCWCLTDGLEVARFMVAQWWLNAFAVRRESTSSTGGMRLSGEFSAVVTDDQPSVRKPAVILAKPEGFASRPSSGGADQMSTRSRSRTPTRLYRSGSRRSRRLANEGVEIN